MFWTVSHIRQGSLTLGRGSSLGQTVAHLELCHMSGWPLRMHACSSTCTSDWLVHACHVAGRCIHAYMVGPCMSACSLTCTSGWLVHAHVQLNLHEWLAGTCMHKLGLCEWLTGACMCAVQFAQVADWCMHACSSTCTLGRLAHACMHTAWLARVAGQFSSPPPAGPLNNKGWGVLI